MRRWRKEGRAKAKDLFYTVPEPGQKEACRLDGNRTEPSMTWIGYAAFLLQIGGLNVHGHYDPMGMPTLIRGGAEPLLLVPAGRAPG